MFEPSMLQTCLRRTKILKCKFWNWFEERKAEYFDWFDSVRIKFNRINPSALFTNGDEKSPFWNDIVNLTPEEHASHERARRELFNSWSIKSILPDGEVLQHSMSVNHISIIAQTMYKGLLEGKYFIENYNHLGSSDINLYEKVFDRTTLSKVNVLRYVVCILKSDIRDLERNDGNLASTLIRSLCLKDEACDPYGRVKFLDSPCQKIALYIYLLGVMLMTCSMPFWQVDEIKLDLVKAVLCSMSFLIVFIFVTARLPNDEKHTSIKYLPFIAFCCAFVFHPAETIPVIVTLSKLAVDIISSVMLSTIDASTPLLSVPSILAISIVCYSHEHIKSFASSISDWLMKQT